MDTYTYTFTYRIIYIHMYTYTCNVPTHTRVHSYTDDCLQHTTANGRQTSEAKRR